MKTTRSAADFTAAVLREGDPLRKGTNPTLVTIAEVGHLVLLWRPKPAALPANDVVSAVALLKRGARLWRRPTATSPSIK